MAEKQIPIIFEIGQKVLAYRKSHTVFETLRKIKKQGHVQEIAKGKWLRNYALSHHDHHLSTVATFSRPNRIGDLLFADPLFYFCPV